MGLTKTSNLTLEGVAIGSLPCTDADEAMYIVEKYFPNVPFWPQLTKISKKEDMLVQFLENMPSFFIEKNCLDSDYKDFTSDLKFFLNDYNKIILDKNAIEFDKYGLSRDYASAFERFIHLVKNKRPRYAKGQIAGPFTLLTTFHDKNGTTAIHSPLFREIMLKTLILKTLWQIKEIKKASPETIPIIFIDEPSLSKIQVFDETMQNYAASMIREISAIIRANGGLSGVHCCSKCDWRIPISAGVDIINPDAFFYPEALNIFSNEIINFINHGGKLALGIVPTREKNVIESLTIQTLEEKFEEAVKNLTNKGFDEKIIIDNLIITSACGAGNLDERLALKAMEMTFELSKKLKKKYSVR